MTKRVESHPVVSQLGIGPVYLQRPNHVGFVEIELCDLPRIIKQLQDIQESTNIDHVPDITGICRVCGNECLNWDSNEL